MRIGLVTPEWPADRLANGIATAVRHLHDGLIATGCEAHIISLGRSDACTEVTCLPPPRRATLLERARMRLGQRWVYNRIRADQIAAAGREAMRRHDIEALVMEETWGWFGTVQKALPIPVIATLHGPWFLQKSLEGPVFSRSESVRREALEREALRLCAGVAAPSRNVLEATEAASGPFVGPAAVVPNPIPVDDPVDYATLSPEARRSLLFVGRFDRLKGGGVVLEAFAEMVRRGIDAHLTFVGPDKGLRTETGDVVGIRDCIAALPGEAARRIDYRGLCSREEIARLRRRHAVALVASRYETQGYALLEALAVGSATVATGVGGILEVVEDGKDGLLVRPDDPSGMADACARLLEDPDLMAALGRRGRAKVEARFSPAAAAERLIDLIASARERWPRRA